MNFKTKTIGIFITKIYTYALQFYILTHYKNLYHILIVLPNSIPNSIRGNVGAYAPTVSLKGTFQQRKDIRSGVIRHNRKHAEKAL